MPLSRVLTPGIGKIAQTSRLLGSSVDILLNDLEQIILIRLGLELGADRVNVIFIFQQRLY